MRVLFIAPYLPSKIRVRTYELLRRLAPRHRLHLIALSGVGEQPAAELAGMPDVTVEPIPLSLPRALANCARAAFTGRSLWAAYGRHAGLEAAVRQALSRETYDIVHVEHIRAAYAMDSVPAGGPPVVFDGVDCITALFEQYWRGSAAREAGAPRRLLYRSEWERMRRYEPAVTRRARATLVTSAWDRDRLIALGADGSRVHVVRNGVDLTRFRPGPEAEEDIVVFSGKMSFFNNADAARYFHREIWPTVRRRRPGAKWLVVGAEPPPDLQALARRRDVEVTGYVEDLPAALRRARVAVCPLRVAVGVQNKLLEAMAVGLPVVATSAACRALEVKDGEELLIADSPDAFAYSVQMLLENVDRRREIGRRGRAYVETHHEWDQSIAALEQVYEDVRAEK
jgi:sugar transferase (PEP-CTERM/EpsH1 system associated)